MKELKIFRCSNFLLMSISKMPGIDCNKIKMRGCTDLRTPTLIPPISPLSYLTCNTKTIHHIKRKTIYIHHMDAPRWNSQFTYIWYAWKLSILRFHKFSFSLVSYCWPRFIDIFIYIHKNSTVGVLRLVVFFIEMGVVIETISFIAFIYW